MQMNYHYLKWGLPYVEYIDFYIEATCYYKNY